MKKDIFLTGLMIIYCLALTCAIADENINFYKNSSAVKKQIELYSNALEDYKKDCGQLPFTYQGLEALWQKPILYPIPQNWKGPYISEEIQADPWGGDYVYNNSGKSFCIMCLGRDRQRGGFGCDKDFLLTKSVF